jgi:putative flavoprotein involved in K+ transport
MTRAAGETNVDCVVLGSGPGGLGAAALIQALGLRTVVLERGSGVAAKWRSTYDSLRINTSAWFSYLPGMRLVGAGQWPTRDELVHYYDRYADRFKLDVRVNTEATRVDRSNGSWHVVCDEGVYTAPYVIVATGKDRIPVVPNWPGMDSYQGQVVHSSEYRNADPFRKQRVLVVGTGNSGFDIAIDLIANGAAEVQLSLRTPPHIVRRSIAGIPNDVLAVLSRRVPDPIVDREAEIIRRVSFGDLAAYGIGRPPLGIKSHLRKTGMIPTIDPGHFAEAVRSRSLRVVASVEAFENDQVHLADGSSVRPDAVIAATGYDPGLVQLVGHLGVLTDERTPLYHGPRTHPVAPDLHFIGFTNPISGNLRELRLDAKRIANAVKRKIVS